MGKIASFFGFFKRNKNKFIKTNDALSMISAFLLLFFIAGDQTYQIKERQFMINEIEIKALITGLHSGVYDVNDTVLEAMSRVPRERFLKASLRGYAYKDVALPMQVEGQIVPEPFLTAMMINLLGVTEHDRVLEIGYGIGYEAAILSKMVKKVYSVEQIHPLGSAFSSQGLLSDLENISFKKGFGLHGWKNKGPFDAILIKQAIEEVPQALFDQLSPYGRIVVPLADKDTGDQRMVVYLKMPNGDIVKRNTLYVKFPYLIQGTNI